MYRVEVKRGGRWELRGSTEDREELENLHLGALADSGYQEDRVRIVGDDGQRFDFRKSDEHYGYELDEI